MFGERQPKWSRKLSLSTNDNLGHIELANSVESSIFHNLPLINISVDSELYD